MGKMKDNICKEDKFIDNNNYSYKKKDFCLLLMLSGAGMQPKSNPQ